MAYTTSYDGLVADLQDFAENTNPEFVSQIPNIIARAQDVVQRNLGLDIWRARPYPTITATTLSPYVSRQSGWLEIRSLFIPSLGRFLERRTLDWVRMYGTGSGAPKYYTEISDTELQIVPIPDDGYTIEADVLTRLPSLSSSNQTNWLTENVADLYLLACLIGSEIYLVSPERAATYGGVYEALLQNVRQELRAQERSGYLPQRAAAFPVASPGAHA